MEREFKKYIGTTGYSTRKERKTKKEGRQKEMKGVRNKKKSENNTGIFWSCIFSHTYTHSYHRLKCIA